MQSASTIERSMGMWHGGTLKTYDYPMGQLIEVDVNYTVK
jgi:hypothetical protein